MKDNSKPESRKDMNLDTGKEPERPHCEDCKLDNAGEKSDDQEYWEEMLCMSLGPRGWNIGCGCG